MLPEPLSLILPFYFPWFPLIATLLMFAKFTVGERRIMNVIWEEGFFLVDKNVLQLIVVM